MSGSDSIGPMAHRFWDMGSDYGNHPDLTDDVLADCEALLGVTLPAEYVALLRLRNGGVVNRGYSAFPTRVPTSWAPDHVPFEDCAGIGAGYPSITESANLNIEWGQPEELVLLHGDGHYWIALDYRSGRAAEPSVVWFDNEVGEDLTLAHSFGAFLQGLTEPPSVAP